MHDNHHNQEHTFMYANIFDKSRCREMFKRAKTPETHIIYIIMLDAPDGTLYNDNKDTKTGKRDEENIILKTHIV